MLTPISPNRRASRPIALACSGRPITTRTWVGPTGRPAGRVDRHATRSCPVEAMACSTALLQALRIAGGADEYAEGERPAHHDLLDVAAPRPRGRKAR